MTFLIEAQNLEELLGGCYGIDIDCDCLGDCDFCGTDF